MSCVRHLDRSGSSSVAPPLPVHEPPRQAGNAARPKRPFDELFELAIQFLANPSKLWASGKMEHRNLVLRLTFAERLRYCPETGFRTPKTTFPFSILEGFRDRFEQMAERAGFEPAIRFPVYTLSRRAPSTTRPPLQRACHEGMCDDLQETGWVRGEYSVNIWNISDILPDITLWMGPPLSKRPARLRREAGEQWQRADSARSAPGCSQARR